MEHVIVTTLIGQTVAIVEVQEGVAFNNLIQVALEHYHLCNIAVTKVTPPTLNLGIVEYETEYNDDKWEVYIEYIKVYTLKDL